MIKHRIPALFLALTPIWLPSSVQAEDIQSVDLVAAIDEKITQNQEKIDSVDGKHFEEARTNSQLKQQTEQLQREYAELVAKRNRAKNALDKQFTRLVEEPDIDLSNFQKQYQESWEAVKKNQKEQLSQQHLVSESEMRLSQLKQQQANLNATQQNLQESRVEARVKRLAAELRESAVLETSYNATCAASMTLRDCANQGKLLTKQKAVNTFKSRLIGQLTEANVVKQNLQGVQLNIHVQDSQIIKSGFSGDNSYATKMQAQLQAKPDADAPCKLLGVANRYCYTDSPVATTSKVDKAWANITVRSDQYNDDVTVNGVKYGSTPVELVLPAGRHQITVSKEGFETYNRQITINGNDTIWVKLRPEKHG
ncbi:PEGA domain-containing protein [Vibrio sp. S9_S30]|uniref:PEGA domain-containing protein n=1 Tax=Vibrio sp. S9_S30 TaxID=2720226 RepID=UPI0016800A29|nr:PEGA domain-containing protein [Vibrio sp. S9_S30]MBD1558092.1 PEGA domain-containing protein [Vibrio sp. S9_S30]